MAPMPDATLPVTSDPATVVARAVPEKVSLDGIEDRWAGAWQQQGTYAFDRTRSREQVYAIDTPPPTVSGSLHVGHVFSYTHTDVVARFRRRDEHGRARAERFGLRQDEAALPGPRPARDEVDHPSTRRTRTLENTRSSSQ